MTTGDDTLLLGIDLVLDDRGRIAHLHRPRHAADRTPPAELINVLGGLTSPRLSTP